MVEVVMFICSVGFGFLFGWAKGQEEGVKQYSRIKSAFQVVKELTEDEDYADEEEDYSMLKDYTDEEFDKIIERYEGWKDGIKIRADFDKKREKRKKRDE